MYPLRIDIGYALYIINFREKLKSLILRTTFEVPCTFKSHTCWVDNK